MSSLEKFRLCDKQEAFNLMQNAFNNAIVGKDKKTFNALIACPEVDPFDFVALKRALQCKDETFFRAIVSLMSVQKFRETFALKRSQSSAQRTVVQAAQSNENSKSKTIVAANNNNKTSINDTKKDKRVEKPTTNDANCIRKVASACSDTIEPVPVCKDAVMPTVIGEKPITSARVPNSKSILKKRKLSTAAPVCISTSSSSSSSSSSDSSSSGSSSWSSFYLNEFGKKMKFEQQQTTEKTKVESVSKSSCKDVDLISSEFLQQHQSAVNTLYNKWPFQYNSQRLKDHFYAARAHQECWSELFSLVKIMQDFTAKQQKAIVVHIHNRLSASRAPNQLVIGRTRQYTALKFFRKLSWFLKMKVEYRAETANSATEFAKFERFVCTFDVPTLTSAMVLNARKEVVCEHVCEFLRKYIVNQKVLRVSWLSETAETK